jgi:hypothetical protein
MMSSTSRYSSLLVPDIWPQIVDFLGKGDLNSLCRTSRSFLDLLRPKLYHEVYLTTKRPTSEEFDKYTVALKLLVSNPELARYVQVFHVHGPVHKFESNRNIGSIPDYYLRAIQNMPSLRSLTITGSIVGNADAQKLLVDTLSRLDPPLTEFYHEEMNDTWDMPSADFSLPSLTKLNWRVSPSRGGYGEIHTRILNIRPLLTANVHDIALRVASLPSTSNVQHLGILQRDDKVTYTEF